MDKSSKIWYTIFWVSSMITKLSKILSIVLPITSFVLFYFVARIKLVYCFLLAIATFLLVILVFCIYILVLFPILGKIWAKTYDPKNKTRWKFMNDVSEFSCFWLNIKIHKSGFDKLVPGNTYVFYSNHQSFLDIIAYDLCLKDFPRGSMYKKEHDNSYLISGMVKSLGGIPVDRSNDRAAVKSIIEIINALNSGDNFMIYPEGTRSKGPNIGEYHAGSFKICQKANCKTVILAIDGAYKKRISIPFVRSNINVKVVDVLDSDEVKNISTLELSKMAREKTIDAIREMRSKDVK